MIFFAVVGPIIGVCLGLSLGLTIARELGRRERERRWDDILERVDEMEEIVRDLQGLDEDRRSRIDGAFGDLRDGIYVAKGQPTTSMPNGPIVLRPGPFTIRRRDDQ